MNKKNRRRILSSREEYYNEDHVGILINFASVWPRISFERAFDNEVLLESLSFSFERIRHFGPAKLSLQFHPKSHIYIGL